MKRIFIISVLFLLLTNVYGQEKRMNQLVELYKNADTECYTDLIQKSMDEFNCWLEDSLFRWEKENSLSLPSCQAIFNMGFQEYVLKPSKVKLRDESKLFVLMVYVDWDEYVNNHYDIDLAECIHIDSLRTFMIACIDKKKNIKGFTDLYERGLYLETDASYKCNGIFVNQDVFHSIYGKKALKMAYRKYPFLQRAEAIIYVINDMMFSVTPSSFIFVCDGKLMRWDFLTRNLQEYNSFVRERMSYWESDNENGGNLNRVREILLSQMYYSSVYDSDKNNFGDENMIPKSKYGHTHTDRVRMCR